MAAGGYKISDQRWDVFCKLRAEEVADKKHRKELR